MRKCNINVLYTNILCAEKFIDLTVQACHIYMILVPSLLDIVHNNCVFYIYRPEQVAHTMIEMVEDDSLNGECLIVKVNSSGVHKFADA